MSIQIGSTDNSDYEFNNSIQSPLPETEGAFVNQKALIPKPFPSLDYDMDLYQSSQKNPDEIFKPVIQSKKDEEYEAYLNELAQKKKQEKNQKYVGFFSRLGEAFKHPGNILQRIGTKAVPDTLIETAMMSDTYLKMLSMMETATENPDYATDVLTSDVALNYLKGQADYLDNDMFELYRNSDYRYAINTAGLSAGVGAGTFLASLGSQLAMGGAAVGIGAAASAALPIALGAAAFAGVAALGYWGYKAWFDKDPYDDKSLGHNEETEPLLDEFGHEQGLRMIASKNLRQIASILERVKKLDKQDPFYKQTRNTLLNKVTVLSRNIEETTTELSGEAFGAIDDNSQLVSILKQNNFATNNLQEFANIQSNRKNKAIDISKKYNVIGTSSLINTAYDNAKARSEKIVLQKYYGGNEEIFLGDKVNHPEKIKGLVDETIGTLIQDEMDNAEHKVTNTKNSVTESNQISFFKDKQTETLNKLSNDLQNHILEKAQGIAENMAIDNLKNVYYQKARSDNMPQTMEQFIANNLDRAKQIVMPYAIGLSKNIVRKSIKEQNILLPENSNKMYLETKKGAPAPNLFGLTLDDENLVSEVNDELYQVSTQDTLQDFLGQKREKKLDPLFKTPQWYNMRNQVLNQVNDYRSTAIKAYFEKYNKEPLTQKEWQEAENIAQIPDEYRTGGAIIDESFANKLTERLYNPEDFLDENDPFKPLKNIKETFGTLSKLSDDALDVVRKHLALSYTTNKEKEHSLKLSDEPDFKVNEYQLKRFKDIITLNWIEDLKYLRKAWYNGDFSNTPEITGKDEIPSYWSARAESWSEDFLIGKIFGIRRTGSFAGRADIEASDNLEIQRLNIIRKAFIEKYGENSPAVKFIEERQEFYHNAIQHSLMASMVGKELYDRDPMFAQVIFEAPYDAMQGLSAGLLNSGTTKLMAKYGGINFNKFAKLGKLKSAMQAAKKKSIKVRSSLAKAKNLFRKAKAANDTKAISKLSKKINVLEESVSKAKSTYDDVLKQINTVSKESSTATKVATNTSKAKKNAEEYLRYSFAKNYVKSQSEGHPMLVSGPIWALFKEYIGTKFSTEALSELLNKAEMQIGREFGELLSKNKERAIQYANSLRRKDIGKESISNIVRKTAKLIKKLGADDVGERLEKWSTKQHWFDEEYFGTKWLRRSSTNRSKSYETEVFKKLDDFVNHIEQLDVSGLESTKDLIKQFTKLTSDFVKAPSDAGTKAKFYKRLVKLFTKKAAFKNMESIRGYMKNMLNQNDEFLRVQRNETYDMLDTVIKAHNHIKRTMDNAVSDTSNFIRGIEKLSSSVRLKDFSANPENSRSMLNVIVDMLENMTKRKLDYNLELIAELQKHHKGINGSIDLVAAINEMKTQLDEAFIVARDSINSAKGDAINNIDDVFGAIRMIISGTDKKSNPLLLGDIASNALHNDSYMSIPKLSDHISTLSNKIAYDNAKIVKANYLIEKGLIEGLDETDITLLKKAYKIIKSNKMFHELNQSERKTLIKLQKFDERITSAIDKSMRAIDNPEDLYRMAKDIPNINLWNVDMSHLKNQDTYNKYIRTMLSELVDKHFNDTSTPRVIKKDIFDLIDRYTSTPFHLKYAYDLVDDFKDDAVLHMLSGLFEDNENIFARFKGAMGKVREKSMSRMTTDYNNEISNLLQRTKFYSSLKPEELKESIFKSIYKMDIKEAQEQIDIIKLRISKTKSELSSLEELVPENNPKLLNLRESLEEDIDLYNMLTNPRELDDKLERAVTRYLEKAGTAEKFTEADVAEIFFNKDISHLQTVQKNFVKKVIAPKYLKGMQPQKVKLNNINISTATITGEGLHFVDSTNVANSKIIESLDKELTKINPKSKLNINYINTKALSGEELTALIDNIKVSNDMLLRGPSTDGIMFIARDDLLSLQKNKKFADKSFSDIINTIIMGSDTKELQEAKNYQKFLKRFTKSFVGFDKLDVNYNEFRSFNLYGEIDEALTSLVEELGHKNFGTIFGINLKNKDSLRTLDLFETYQKKPELFDEVIERTEKLLNKHALSEEQYNKIIYTQDTIKDLLIIDDILKSKYKDSGIEFKSAIDFYITQKNANVNPFGFLTRKLINNEEVLFTHDVVLNEAHFKKWLMENISTSGLSKTHIRRLMSDKNIFDGSALQSRSMRVLRHFSQGLRKWKCLLIST